MRIKITKPGIFNAKGEEIPVGTQLTVKGEPKGWEGRYETISGDTEGKDEVANPAGPVAKHRGGGSYSIMQGDDELVEKLTKEEAEAFKAMSDEDKAAFIAERKKPNE